MSWCRWLDALLAAARSREVERPRRDLLDGIATASRAAAIAFLGACAASGGDERELALAAAASERLTTAFADEVAEAGGQRGFENGAGRAAAGSGWVDPCAAPRVSSAGFQRIDLAPFPIAVIAPPGYTSPNATRRIHDIRRDTLSSSISNGGTRITFQRVAYASVNHDERSYLGSCNDMVFGAHVHFDVMGSPRAPTILATYQLGSGAWMTARAAVRDPQETANVVFILRNLSLNF